MFTDFWKYANVQPFHKKGNRRIKENHSLLPMCEKIYSYLNTHNLLSKNESGYWPDDSTISQLQKVPMNPLKSMIKRALYFWTSLKLLIKRGMKV